MTKKKETSGIVVPTLLKSLSFPDEKEIKTLKKKWKNKRIVLLEMVDEMVDDTLSVPSGTHGECYDIDCLGNLQMKWDTGSTLNLLPDIDNFQIENQKGEK